MLFRSDTGGASDGVRCLSGLLVLSVLLVAAGCNDSRDRLVIEIFDGTFPATVRLGSVSKSGQVLRRATIVNRTGSPWQIARLLPSCDCLAVSLPPGPVGANGCVEAQISLDLRADPEFVGRLAPEAVAYDGNGGQLFIITVRADVKSVGTDHSEISSRRALVPGRT